MRPLKFTIFAAIYVIGAITTVFAQVPISQLPSAILPLSGSEIVPGVQGGQTVKISVSAIGDTGGGSSTTITYTVGGITRSVAQRLGDYISVNDEGADPTGSANSTSAFAAAAALSNGVRIPCGTYKTNSTFSGLSNFSLTGTTCTILEPYSAASDVIDDVGGNNDVYSGFRITGPGSSSGSASGITFSSTTNNSRVEGLWVQGFNQNGIACNGSSGSLTSGNEVLNTYSLYNGIADISWTYCQDFHIQGNQFGGTGTLPTYGVYLNNSNAGQLTHNFVWHNGIGVYATGSYYDWINDNRITQSNSYGAQIISSGNLQFEDNQSYHNSNGSTGGYPAFQFTGTRDVVFVGNQFFDWTGVAYTNYSLALDSTSGNFTITGNEFQDTSPTNTIAPTNIASGAYRVMMQGNTPTSSAYTNNVPITGFSFASPSSTGGSGATDYIGQTTATGLNATPFVVGVAGTIQCFTIVGESNPTTNSYVVTLYKNMSATALTGTWTGSDYSATFCSIANAVTVSPDDALLLQVVSSASAPANTFSGLISEMQ